MAILSLRILNQKKIKQLCMWSPIGPQSCLESSKDSSNTVYGFGQVVKAKSCHKLFSGWKLTDIQDMRKTRKMICQVSVKYLTENYLLGFTKILSFSDNHLCSATRSTSFLKSIYVEIGFLTTMRTIFDTLWADQHPRDAILTNANDVRRL